MGSGYCQKHRDAPQYSGCIDCLSLERDEAQAEVERLRAGLEVIAEPQDGLDHQNHCFRCRSQARALLAGKEAEDAG